MGINDIITVLLSALGAGGIVSGLVLRRIAQMEKRDEDFAKARIHENILIMQGIERIGNLSEATANAIKTGHANGEVSAAVKDYKEYCKDLSEFMRECSVEYLHHEK